MSFTWDERTQKRIDKNKRQKKIISWIAIVVVIAAIIGIRIWVIGGWNECFWAQDVGTCLSILNSRN
jgi:uncharacterized membrane protein YiaA